MPDFRARVVATSNVALTGTPIIDTVQTADLDDVFVVGQSTLQDNGLYTIPSGGGAWVRHTSMDASSEFVPGMDVYVKEGSTDYKGSTWYFSNTSTPTLGTTALNFTKRAHPVAVEGVFPVEKDQGYKVKLNQPHAVVKLTPPQLFQVSREGLITDKVESWSLNNHMRGCRLVYNSATTLVLTQGDLYLPFNEARLVSSTSLSPTLTPSTLHYIYGYSSGMANFACGIEVSLTIPDEVQTGQPAAEKLADFTRRYIATFRTDASSQIYNFRMDHEDNFPFVRYLVDTSVSPFRIVSAGTAQTSQTVNLGPSGLALVPPTCREAWLNVSVNASAGVGLSNSEATPTAAAGGIELVSTAVRGARVRMPLDASQSFTWANQAASGSTNVDILGYWDRR